MAERILFTDGEGPLVFKDLAYDMAARISLQEYFFMLSFYDDYLSETGRQGYQAGDTLALLVPHFLAHDVTQKDLVREAQTTEPIRGVEEYMTGLYTDGWHVRVISTAYRPLWDRIGSMLTIPAEHIACTDIDLDAMYAQFDTNELTAAVLSVEQDSQRHANALRRIVQDASSDMDIQSIVKQEPLDQIVSMFDELYWKTLPSLGLHPLFAIRVVGGKRKVEEAIRFARELGTTLADVVYIGDSITDDALLARISDEGGLAVCVNGNKFALRHADVAVACEDMRALRPLLDEWAKGGLEAAVAYVEQSNGGDAVYSWIDHEDEKQRDELVSVHSSVRTAVRGQAAMLG